MLAFIFRIVTSGHCNVAYRRWIKAVEPAQNLGVDQLCLHGQEALLVCIQCGRSVVQGSVVPVTMRVASHKLLVQQTVPMWQYRHVATSTSHGHLDKHSGSPTTGANCMQRGCSTFSAVLTSMPIQFFGRNLYAALSIVALLAPH